MQRSSMLTVSRSVRALANDDSAQELDPFVLECSECDEVVVFSAAQRARGLGLDLMHAERSIAARS
jgi:hypothetical protein